MYPKQEISKLTVLAPAKLNLTLEVVAKRPDGFHEIRSVVQTINLCDTFRFHLSHNIEFLCDRPDWTAEQSLVVKATSLLQETTKSRKGAIIEINKRVPLVSGLGGDSSDAAAILRGLNRLWGLELSSSELVDLASELGSDVAFFFWGGTALIKGKGEVVAPLPSLPHMWIVLMVPPVPRIIGGKTAQLYASLEASHYTDGLVTEELVALLTKGKEVAPANLFNVFDSVAIDRFAGLGDYWEQFLQAGAQEVHLAGSGPTLFSLAKDKVQAEKIYKHLQQQGLESYLTDTLAAIDRLE
jgi:4-diphosphocytidyl-2-C-methyl-D-erythritol kinase